MSSSTFLFIHHLRLTVPAELNTSPWTTLEMVQAFFLWRCGHESLCRCITENEDSIDFTLNCSARCISFYLEAQSHICVTTVNMSFVRVSLWISWNVGCPLYSCRCRSVLCGHMANCLKNMHCVSVAGLELAYVSQWLQRPSACKENLNNIINRVSTINCVYALGLGELNWHRTMSSVKHGDWWWHCC